MKATLLAAVKWLCCGCRAVLWVDFIWHGVHCCVLLAAGKTLTVHAVARRCREGAQGCEAAPALISINCMALQSPTAVFARLLEGIQAAAQLPLRPDNSGADCFIRPCEMCKPPGCPWQLDLHNCTAINLILSWPILELKSDRCTVPVADRHSHSPTHDSLHAICFSYRRVCAQLLTGTENLLTTLLGRHERRQ
jgi:hypothetical protein